MIKKILLIVITGFLLLGCDDYLHYSGVGKIVFEGRVLDETGQPLPGILVSTYIQKYDQPGSPVPIPFSQGSEGDEDTISYTKTDDNGYYRMVFPKPNNQDNISVMINKPINEAGSNPQYSNTTITNIIDSDLADYGADLGEQKLFNLNGQTTLTVTLQNPANITDFILTAEGLVQDKIDYYTMPSEFDFNMYYYIPTTQNDAYYMYKFYVAKNQDVVIKYTLIGNNFPLETTIHIGSDPIDYTINL